MKKTVELWINGRLHEPRLNVLNAVFVHATMKKMGYDVKYYSDIDKLVITGIE